MNEWMKEMNEWMAEWMKVVQIDFMANFKCLWALANLTDRISPYVRDRIEDCSLRFSSMLLGELFVHSRQLTIERLTGNWCVRRCLHICLPSVRRNVMTILVFNPIVLEGWTRAIINPIDFSLNDCCFIHIQDISGHCFPLTCTVCHEYNKTGWHRHRHFV